MFLVGFLISYGSLYPFVFASELPSEAEIREFLGSLGLADRRANIVANIVLFLPLGLLAPLLDARGTPQLKQLAWVFVCSALLAFGLQVVQLFLPVRDAALSDGLWNLLGLGLGMAVALPFAQRLADVTGAYTGGMPELPSFPVVLGCCWLAYCLVPYVPSLDLQSIKNSLKPLLLDPDISLSSVLRHMAGWMAFAALWHSWRRGWSSDLALLAIVPVVFAAKVLVVNNTVTLSNVIGASAGLVIWWSVRHFPVRYTLAALVVASVIAVLGLMPFEFSSERAAFRLVPFSGLLTGSMYVNSQQLLLKSFFYGALIWLLVQSGWRTRSTTLAVALGLLLIEISQMWLPGRTPESTDVVLVLLLSWIMGQMVGLHGDRQCSPRRRSRRAT